MQGNINNYTQSNLQFSNSKLYFQHQNKLLQKIWFISPMSIDVYFRYTFQEVSPDYFIEWWEFEWLTVDHDVHEQWIIYKIWFINPKFKNIESFSLDMKKDYFNNPSIRSLIRWLLWWLIVFFILMWLWSKSQFAKVLLWINIVWALVLLIFYGIKIWKILLKKMWTKSVKYWWFNVEYSNHSDALMASHELIDALKNLEKNFWIMKFCYTGNCIYLLQDIHDRDWNRLTSSSKLYSEQEKASLQQRTMEYLRSQEFLSLFIEN